MPKEIDIKLYNGKGTTKITVISGKDNGKGTTATVIFQKSIMS